MGLLVKMKMRIFESIMGSSHHLLRRFRNRVTDSVELKAVAASLNSTVRYKKEEDDDNGQD